MKLLVINMVPFHYEIIESVVIKHQKIINKECDEIIIQCVYDKSYFDYIGQKYPKINLKTEEDRSINCDYMINCTFYDSDLSRFISLDKNRYFFISHRIKPGLLCLENFFFLSPLCKNNNFIIADILPYQNEKIKTTYPIFVIQGNITNERKNYKLLENILKFETKYKFKIKVVGKGKLDDFFDEFKDKIITKYDLNFVEYHREFLDCYCIISLITKQSHPQYYSTQLTSTISYGLSYKLKFLIDKDLKDIYEIENNVTFNNEDDIADKFGLILDQFYKNN